MQMIETKNKIKLQEKLQVILGSAKGKLVLMAGIFGRFCFVVQKLYMHAVHISS